MMRAQHLESRIVPSHYRAIADANQQIIDRTRQHAAPAGDIRNAAPLLAFHTVLLLPGGRFAV